MGSPARKNLLVTAKEIAGFLSISVPTLKRWVEKDPNIPAGVVDGLWMAYAEDLEGYFRKKIVYQRKFDMDAE